MWFHTLGRAWKAHVLVKTGNQTVYTSCSRSNTLDLRNPADHMLKNEQKNPNRLKTHALDAMLRYVMHPCSGNERPRTSELSISHAHVAALAIRTAHAHCMLHHRTRMLYKVRVELATCSFDVTHLSPDRYPPFEPALSTHQLELRLSQPRSVNHRDVSTRDCSIACKVSVEYADGSFDDGFDACSGSINTKHARFFKIITVLQIMVRFFIGCCGRQPSVT